MYLSAYIFLVAGVWCVQGLLHEKECMLKVGRDVTGKYIEELTDLSPGLVETEAVKAGNAIYECQDKCPELVDKCYEQALPYYEEVDRDGVKYLGNVMKTARDELIKKCGMQTGKDYKDCMQKIAADYIKSLEDQLKLAERLVEAVGNCEEEEKEFQDSDNKKRVLDKFSAFRSLLEKNRKTRR